MKPLTDWLVYFLVRVAVCVIQSLSPEACQGFARLMAYLAADVLRVRHAVVDDNVRHVYPHLTTAERRVLIRRMWEHLVLMGCEIALAPRKVHETNWRDYFHLQHKRELVSRLLEPRPCVMVSGHFGNFELGSYATGLLGFPTFAIARPLDNAFLDRWINRFRSTNGQFILPKDGSSGMIDAVLRSGGIVSLLGDQHAGPKGCWVDFLGRPASCHKAVALLSLSSGAPLLVSYAKRIGGPLEFDIGLEESLDPLMLAPERANVKAMTQWYNGVLERVIRSAPDQYWWVHRRWKEPPVKRAKSGAVPPIEERRTAA